MAMTTPTAKFFEDRPNLRYTGSTEFSLHKWDAERNAGIAPRWESELAEDEQARYEFLLGARAYGLELGTPGKFGQLKPQQLRIADVLAAGAKRNVIEIPRRASKTTSIFMTLFGRCLARPGYQVTFSAQSGVAGSRRLREWKTRLDAVRPPDDQDLAPWLRGRARNPKATSRHLALFGEELAPEVDDAEDRRGFRILLGEVGKGIYFENGSTFLVLSPDPGAYRGEAADVSWIDEAQEVDPDIASELLAAIRPLQDTKPGSQIVLSGTAGEARVGPFWDYLNQLRAGEPSIAGLDYAAAEDTPWELVDDEDSAMELIAGVHPGVGTLTDLPTMRENYRDPSIGRPQWAREYLSIWPESFGSRAIDAGLWDAARLEKKPAIPTRVAFGLAIKPGGGAAAIVAAWRSPSGLAYVEVVEHRAGTKWLVEGGPGDQKSGWLSALTQRYRGSSVAYDHIAEGAATVAETDRITPRPRMQAQPIGDLYAGCVQFLRELERGTLRHSGQNGLESAVAVAAKREVRGNDRGIWLWTPAEPGADITCLDAATRALRNWDKNFARRTVGARPYMGT